MKLRSLFILVASSVSVCYSQVAVTSDTNITLTMASNGNVTNVRGLNDPMVGNLHRDMWAAGIKDSDAATKYSSTCNFSNAVVVHFTSAKSVVVCTSSLVITHEFTKSRSTQMIKGTITLTNNGSSALPVVQYRRFTDYNVGGSSNNYLSNYGIGSAANLIKSCFAKFSIPDLGSISYDFAPACALALAVTAAFDDYTALYEYKFGPIAAGSSVTFNVYYGASAGIESSVIELAKECVEVGSLFMPTDNDFNYTYYVGYAGVGGDNTTFGPCDLAPVPVPVPVPVPLPVPVPVPVPVTVRVPFRVLPPPVSAPVPTGSCFSVLSTVEEKDQGIIPITALKIGDYVKTATGIYTLVYGFLHFDHDREETFIQIHLEGVPAPLEISSHHLVFVGPDDRPYPVIAADVVVGDMLTGNKVMSLGNVVRRGVYAPVTMSGDIAVNGIRASNYVDPINYGGWYNGHTVIHAAYGLQRLFCRYFMEICRKETYIDGYGRYTRFLLWCAAVLINLRWMSGTFVAAIRISLSATMPVIGMVGMLLILVIVMKNTKRVS